MSSSVTNKQHVESVTVNDEVFVPISKLKKKPYWVEVDIGNAICIYGHNGFLMCSGEYNSKREANQMAKRLAANLGLEFRK